MVKFTGPDPSFPYYDVNQRFIFPDPLESENESMIAWGGNLSPGMLLSAYEQGLFPWYGDDNPVIWHSPNPRFVLFPENLHVSSSMKKLIKNDKFVITLNKDFSAVIKGCAEINRRDQDLTWIDNNMIDAYIELHKLGYAHSAEAWLNGELAGGCYGVRLSGVFFGESMFAKISNASKAALIFLVNHLQKDGVSLIDCQVKTPHLYSLGAREMDRKEFIRLLKEKL